MRHELLKKLVLNGDQWEGKAYFNTAAEGLPLIASADAVREYLNTKSTGEPGRVRLWQEYEQARGRAANLFNVTAKQIGLISSTTEALVTIANSIDWKPGDEVVFTSVEFPSNIFPWVVLQQKGVKIRVVKPRHGLIQMDELLSLINEKTRLVTFSQVSFSTGQHLDPRPVYERVKNTDTLLCVDATQAAARVPVHGESADFTIASAFKWMNSIHGTAIMSVSDKALASGLNGPAGWLSTEDCFAADRLERFHPRHDAQQLQLGMPNFDSVMSVNAALAFHTPESVAQRREDLNPLVERLVDGLSELGAEVLCPRSAEDRAGIVPIACEKSEELKSELLKSNILLHGNDGKLRAAVHWYNDESDVEQYLSELKRWIDRPDFFKQREACVLMK